MDIDDLFEFGFIKGFKWEFVYLVLCNLDRWWEIVGNFYSYNFVLIYVIDLIFDLVV